LQEVTNNIFCAGKKKMTRKEDEMSGDDSVTEVAATVRADLGLDADQGESSVAKKRKAKKTRKVRKEAPPADTESSSEIEERKTPRKKKKKKVI
jgi:hypothetical protein